MTGDKLNNDARTRIQTMIQTNDGFKISEVDMQLRGPGEIEGIAARNIAGRKPLAVAGGPCTAGGAGRTGCARTLGVG